MSRHVKARYVKVCPICNSTDVSPDLTVPAAVASGALYTYRCNRCGYTSMAFPEFPLDELGGEGGEMVGVGRYPVMDVSYGRGYASLLRLLSPLALLIFAILSFLNQNVFYLIGTLIFAYLTVYLNAGLRASKFRVIGALAVILYVVLYNLV